MIFIFAPFAKKVNFNQYEISEKTQKKEFIFYFDRQKNFITVNNKKFQNKYFEKAFLFLKKINFMNYGEFVIHENERWFQLFKRIIENKRYVRKIYIPSGANKFLLIKILNHAQKVFGPEIKFEDFEDGELFPETYHYYFGESRQNLLKIMKIKTETLLNQFWEQKNVNLPYKSKKDALILASLIEKEAFLEADKPLIASVFLNRLRLGMKIQSDPTAQYANKINNYLRAKKGLEAEKFDIKIKSSLNTYFVDGLPDRPISNVSQSSLYAAFHPAKTDFLYFISFPGDSKLIFTKEYEKHLKNVMILRKKQKELG